VANRAAPNYANPQHTYAAGADAAPTTADGSAVLVTEVTETNITANSPATEGTVGAVVTQLAALQQNIQDLAEVLVAAFQGIPAPVVNLPAPIVTVQPAPVVLPSGGAQDVTLQNNTLAIVAQLQTNFQDLAEVIVAALQSLPTPIVTVAPAPVVVQPAAPIANPLPVTNPYSRLAENALWELIILNRAQLLALVSGLGGHLDQDDLLAMARTMPGLGISP
jgi:hypothetical protein